MPDQSSSDASKPLPGWLMPFYENPGLTIGALIAAAIIWFYIRGKVEDVLVVTAKLELSVEGVAKEKYTITGKYLNDNLVRENIQLKLRGPKSKLEQIKNQESLMVAKTIAVTEEMNLDEPIPVTITEKDLKLDGQNLPFGIRMTKANLTLEVDIQKEVTVTRQISRGNLEGNRETFTTGDTATDYRIAEVVPQVETVDVTGPENQIENVQVVPVSPIDVSGRATDVTKQVALTTQPPSENVSLSVQNVAITVKIVSRLTEKDIKQKFSVVSGPELSSYLQKRNWKFEPADRMLTITFSVPNSTANQFSTEDITPILMLPPEEIEAIQDPTRPHTVSTEDFITVLIDRSIENRARIQREEIQPKTIKFVPVESDE